MIIDPRKIIIKRRDLRSRGDVLLSVSLPLAFGVALFYLARPLAVLIGWSTAAAVLNSAAGAGNRPELMPDFLGSYFPVIIGLCFSLFCWALYNRLRFGGSRDQRRASPPSVGVDEIASACPFGVGEVRRIRRAEVLFFFFDDKGAVIGVKCRKVESDTDYTLAQAAALAPAVAVGMDLPKTSEAVRRIPSAPRANPLRHVPVGTEELSFRPLPVVASAGRAISSGGVSPEI